MSARYRPVPRTGGPRPPGALPIAGGPVWFSEAVRHSRGTAPDLVPVAAVPAEIAARIASGRAAVCGLSLDRPRLMAVLNVTPDSFSDGGRHLAPADALARARALLAAGADLLDIGGESTRPGAEPVPEAEERARILPVIAALRAEGVTAPISVDTRKAGVAEAAFAAGADLWNDVSALTHDPASPDLAARSGRGLCLMHAQGDPRTMQLAPRYDDVLLDVCDYLDGRLAAAEALGIPRARVILDPGIGFGKTTAHNLDLIRGLALFHALGAPLLVGVSRKRFIGEIGDAPVASERAPGSIAVALEALRQGVQLLRVHDVAETRQAVALWWALNGGQDRAGAD